MLESVSEYIGAIVSNHGGSAIDSQRATIGSLPDVVEAIDSKIPVLVDRGFRRGTDVFKVLAIAADAAAHRVYETHCNGADVCAAFSPRQVAARQKVRSSHSRRVHSVY